MIITVTPIVAVKASSRTISISMNAITMKPSAFASSAIAPGMNSFWNECVEAVTPSAPCSVSSFHAFVICTACDTAIEKIRNGTRIDIGSRPSPKTGSSPSSQITGTMAQISASAVIISEPEYQYSRTEVITKATPKNTSTPAAPLAMSPTALAKPMMCTPTLSFSYLARIFSRSPATRCRSRRSPVSGSFSMSVATTIADGVVVRHEPADPVGLEQVLAHLFQLLRRAREVGRDDVAAAEAVLDDLVVPHVRGEQRRDRAALDALDVEDFLGDLAQVLHELLVVDVALLVLQRHQHLVGAAEVRPVLQERLHVRVLERDHLGECRLHAQLARHRAEQRS